MKSASLLYRAAYVLLSGAALLSWLGVLEGEMRLWDLVYFTTLSNLLCWLLLLGYVIAGLARRSHAPVNPLPHVKGALTLGILVAGLLFFLLPGPASVSLASAALHFLCPLLMLLDYFLFDVKGRYRWYAPLLWLLLPAAYAVFALIWGWLGAEIPGTGSAYPYPFLDPRIVGALVVLYVGVLLLIILAMGYAFLVLDRFLDIASRKNRRRTS